MPPSRLSSILVRDGLVSVKRMEHAFQRQVIHGGCLDSILLEMDLLPEERLVQYLSLATGLPPATRQETDAYDLRAAERCPIDVARMFRVVPLSCEDNALRVLVHDPVDLGLLEELANELDLPVQPLVVPEYRFHVVFSRMYGGPLDARYAALARRIEDSVPVSPVGKARSVIVDEQVGDGTAAAGPAASAPLAGVPLASAPAAAEPPAAEPEQLDPSTQITPPSGHRVRATLEMASGALVRRIEARLARELADDDVTAVSPAPTMPSASPGLVSVQPRSLVAQDTAPLAPAGSTPAAAAGTHDGASRARDDASHALADTALEPAQAIQLLEQAEERDQIFNLLLRAIRYRASFAGLLTVQGDAAIGRVALSNDRADHAQITQVLVPLDEPSPFRAVAQSAAPHLGPISTTDPEIGAMLQRMGVIGPVSVLLLPVVLRDRVVALGLGHNRDRPVDVSALPELLPVARQAAEAISRLIVKSKSARGRRSESPSTASRPADHAPPSAAAAMAARAPATTDQMPAPMDSVLSAVESDDPALAAHAMDQALQRPAEVLDALRARFPGKLVVERYELEGRVIAAAQHGPLLALIMRLGATATDLLIEKMADPARDLRYYATLCTAELRPPEAIDALVERLFDNDYGVRSTAIAALGGYPPAVLAPGLARIRDNLHSERSERIQAAANALAKLADVHAIPDLVDLIARDERNAENARLALVRLTKQDFGTNARKWRAWWSKSQSQNRIEWLIEGLGHKDDNIRRSAVEDLRLLTGEYFGFHHDLPKREREQARQRWIQWWKQSGRHRFLRGVDPDE